MGRLRVGDWVEVRSKEEILSTLDSKGQLEGMPFMPEMFAFCGQKFQVYKSAHKTCDTVFPTRSRRVDRAVHLATRCDGQAHGGCQASCLIFWKEVWLRRVQNSDSAYASARTEVRTEGGDRALRVGAKEADVWSGTQTGDTRHGTPVYVCQATQLPYATTDLAWWDLRQYLEDYRSGNANLWRIFCGLVYSIYFHVSQAGIGLGRPMRWLYDKLYPLWAGTPFPGKPGRIPAGQPTPTGSLGLKPGDLVRVKSQEEILNTVDTSIPKSRHAVGR